MSQGTTRAMPPIAPLADTLQLVVIEGEDAGASVDLDQPRLVGTSEQADLVLTDRTVSRRHVAVEASAVGARVRDQDSRNGTWLGTGRVHDIEVPAGAEFRIGSTTLRVEAATGSPAPKSEPAPTIESFGRFVGRAKALQPLYQKLFRAAPSNATVLLEGESGTGKELLAEAIHDASERADRPFIVVDCGSQLENLIESELFGHERGAFTGADRARIGAFEQAQGGTIFLDEIGELPLSLQTRLLRVLDRRQVQRLGGDKRIDVDVRIIAATNRNLEREVEASRFRLDLFHRLAVVMVQVPPLRARREDLPQLVGHLARGLGSDESALPAESMERIQHHDWPGNVRELRNHVERLVLLGDMATAPLSLTAAERSNPFDAAAKSGLPYRTARAAVLDAFSEAYVTDMLGRHGDNVSAAARAAGVARRHFQRLKAK